MSIKTCSRVISTILRHKIVTQVHNLPNYNLSRTNICVLCPNIFNLHTARFFSNEGNKSKTAIEEVYYGILTTQIRGVKLFSLLTSFTGLSAQPFIYKEIIAVDNLPLIVAACSCIGFFTVVTPFLLHYITKKYVTKLSYKPETKTYVATTLNFFNIPKTIEFTPDDVHVPEIPGMFTTFIIKGNPLFVDPRFFKDPTHYGKLMGYDKPLDLKLFKTSIDEKEK